MGQNYILEAIAAPAAFSVFAVSSGLIKFDCLNNFLICKELFCPMMSVFWMPWARVAWFDHGHAAIPPVVDIPKPVVTLLCTHTGQNISIPLEFRHF